MPGSPGAQLIISLYSEHCIISSQQTTQFTSLFCMSVSSKDLFKNPVCGCTFQNFCHFYFLYLYVLISRVRINWGPGVIWDDSAPILTP